MVKGPRFEWSKYKSPKCLFHGQSRRFILPNCSTVWVAGCLPTGNSVSCSLRRKWAKMVGSVVIVRILIGETPPVYFELCCWLLKVPDESARESWSKWQLLVVSLFVYFLINSGGQLLFLDLKTKYCVVKWFIPYNFCHWTLIVVLNDGIVYFNISCCVDKWAQCWQCSNRIQE